MGFFIKSSQGRRDIIIFVVMIRIFAFTSIFCLLLLYSEKGRSQDSIQGYFSKYALLSTRMMQDFGIPASLILSIAYIESGGGNSRNCRLLNNHFGIKGGKRYYIHGTKHLTSYKNYESDTLSYRDFCEVMTRKKFYPELKGNMDYTLWIHMIGLTGYATAHTTWKKKVLNIIRKYNLDQFDLKKSPWIEEQPIQPPLK